MIKADTSFRHSSPVGEFDNEIRTDALGIRIPLAPEQVSARAGT
jgi:hypothetical protein